MYFYELNITNMLYGLFKVKYLDRPKFLVASIQTIIITVFCDFNRKKFIIRPAVWSHRTQLS